MHVTATAPALALLTRWREYRRLMRVSSDHHSLTGIAGRRLDDYRRAVFDGAQRGELAAVLHAIGGLLEAQAYTATHRAEGYRLSGVLAHEVAYAAGDDEWRGPRSLDCHRGPVGRALGMLHLAYRGWAPSPRGDRAARRPRHRFRWPRVGRHRVAPGTGADP
jgi:hypothetical protein